MLLLFNHLLFELLLLFHVFMLLLFALLAVIFGSVVRVLFCGSRFALSCFFYCHVLFMFVLFV